MKYIIPIRTHNTGSLLINVPIHSNVQELMVMIHDKNILKWIHEIGGK